MLRIRNHKSIENQRNKAGRTGGRKASAVLLAAVTAFSPLSAQGMMQTDLYGTVYAASAASQEASTDAAASAGAGESSAAAETAPASATAQAAETASSSETAQAAETAASSTTAHGAEVASEEYTFSATDGRAIAVHLAEAPQDPVPSKVMDTDTASLLKLISEGLVVLNENNEPVPGCAESWDISEDGLQWTFHLREDLKWSDGFSMDAADFESLFKKIADTSTEALYGQDLTQNIAGYDEVLKGDVSALQVQAQDDHTLVVNLVTPDPDFARACASWSLLPIREDMQDDFDESVRPDWKNATGNGPYYVDFVNPGQELILRKNPYYRQEQESDDEAAFDTVRWIVNGDINEDYSDYLNGELDAISAIPEEEEKLLHAEDAIQTKVLPDTMGVCFNCRHEVLSDARVRRALSLAVDRVFIASTILQDVYLPEGGDGLVDEGDVESHTSEAKQLLEEAGYKDGEGIPELVCIADRSGGALLTAEYLASVWRELGIDVRVEAKDAEELAQEKTEGTFDIFCGSIYLASDLPTAELAGFTSDNENNISGFYSQEYDLLISQASETSDEKEYADLLEQAIAILQEEVPAAPLAVRCVSWMRKDEYPGICCDSTGCWQLRDIENAEETAEETETVENTENTETSAAAAQNEDFSDQDADSGKVVTAEIPGMNSGQEQNDPAATLPQIGVSDADRQQSRIVSRAATALDVIRSSDTYFEKADETAYLLRQAWVYDSSASDAQRVLSLPKYTEVHLTGTGNRRFVRIEDNGSFRYLKAHKVTQNTALIDAEQAREKAGLAQKEVLTASLHSVKENELAERASDVRAKTDEIMEAIARREMLRTQTRNPNWNGPVLSRGRGSVMGPSGKETYYNLNMNGVISIMRRMGNTDEYWVRDDGCKMLGDYIMCAANLRVHPRGSLVECSLGTCIVCDTGGFASRNSHQLDIAVTW